MLADSRLGLVGEFIGQALDIVGAGQGIDDLGDAVGAKLECPESAK
jgi:hypothetical protein